MPIPAPARFARFLSFGARFLGFAALSVGLATCGAESASPATSGVDATSSDTTATSSDTTATDAATADAGPTSKTLTFDVSKLGPHAVGYRAWDHTYNAPGGLGKRTIKLHMWYPATEAKGDNPLYGGLFLDPESFIDAPLAPPVDATGYPVHTYSHGHQGFGGTSAFLMRAFASHGWVAIAPDHVGNLLADFKPPKASWLFYVRATDISAALDALENLDKSDPMYGLARTEKVLMSGHSFGVHTCWAVAGATFDMAAIEAGCKTTSSPMPSGVCTAAELAVYKKGLRDPRVVASIPMAGSIDRQMFGATGPTSVKIPMLSMSGGKDPVGADTQFASTSGVAMTWIDVAGACHQSFALGSCGTLDKDLGFSVVRTYALAFGRRHVLADASATVVGILAGTSPVSATVTFKHKDADQ